MADAVSSTPDRKYFYTELIRLFLTAPPHPVPAWYVTRSVAAAGRKDLILSRHGPIQQGGAQVEDRQGTGNATCVCSLSFSLHPGKRSPAGLDNLAPRHCLSVWCGHWAGLGRSRRRWGVGTEKEAKVLLPPLPPTSVPQTPPPPLCSSSRGVR